MIRKAIKVWTALALVTVLWPSDARAGALDDVAADPPATGGLVVRVLPGAPAERAGVQAGDVVTHYAGAAVTGQADLAAAVTAHAKDRSALQLTYVRRGGSSPVTVTLPPGKLGLSVVGVQHGKPFQLRPPATDVAFDLAPYEAAPRDEWYAVHAGGAHVGFQHDRVEVKGDRLVITTEFALAAGQSLQHYLVTISATADAKPKLIEAKYVAPLDRASVCTLTPREDGKLVARISEDGKARERIIDLPPDAMHENLAMHLAPAMPMKAGACLHYRAVTLLGDLADPTAECVGDPGQTEVTGKQVSAVPVTSYSLGKRGRTAWVEPATRTVVRFEYPNGATALRATREQALAGVNPKLKPRT